MHMALPESLPELCLATSLTIDNVKIDSSFSSWSKLTQGVPQGSVIRASSI